MESAESLNVVHDAASGTDNAIIMGASPSPLVADAASATASPAATTPAVTRRLEDCSPADVALFPEDSPATSPSLPRPSGGIVRRHKGVGTDNANVGDLMTLQASLRATQRTLAERTEEVFAAKREHAALNLTYLEAQGQLQCKKKAIAYLRTTLYQDLLALRRQTQLLEQGLIFDMQNTVTVGMPIPLNTYSTVINNGGGPPMDPQMLAEGQAEFPPTPGSGGTRGVGGGALGKGFALGRNISRGRGVGLGVGFAMGLQQQQQQQAASASTPPTAAAAGGGVPPLGPFQQLSVGALAPEGSTSSVPPLTATPTTALQQPPPHLPHYMLNPLPAHVIPNAYDDFSYLDAFKLLESDAEHTTEEMVKMAVAQTRTEMQKVQQLSKDAMDRRLAKSILELNEVEEAYHITRRHLQEVEQELESKSEALIIAVAQEKERLKALQEEAIKEAEDTFRAQILAMEEHVKAGDERCEKAMAEATALKDECDAKLLELDNVFINHRREVGVLKAHIAKEKAEYDKLKRSVETMETERDGTERLFKELQQRLGDEKEANQRLLGAVGKLKGELNTAQTALTMAASQDHQLQQLNRQIKVLKAANQQQKEAMEELTTKNAIMENDLTDANAVVLQRHKIESELKLKLDASYEKEDKLRDALDATMKAGDEAAVLTSLAKAHGGGAIASVKDLQMAFAQALMREQALKDRIRLASVLSNPKNQLQQVRAAFTELISLLPAEVLTAKGDPRDPSNTPDRTIRSGIEKLYELNNYMDAATLTLLSEGPVVLPPPPPTPAPASTKDGTLLGDDAAIGSRPTSALSRSRKGRTPTPTKDKDSGGGGGDGTPSAVGTAADGGDQHRSQSPTHNTMALLSTPASMSHSPRRRSKSPIPIALHANAAPALPSHVPERYGSRGCELQFRLPKTDLRWMGLGLGELVGMNNGPKAAAEEQHQQPQAEGSREGSPLPLPIGLLLPTNAGSLSASSSILPAISSYDVVAPVERAFREAYGELSADDVRYLDAMRMAILMSSAEKAAGWARAHEAPTPTLSPPNALDEINALLGQKAAADGGMSMSMSEPASKLNTSRRGPRRLSSRPSLRTPEGGGAGEVDAADAEVAALAAEPSMAEAAAPTLAKAKRGGGSPVASSFRGGKRGANANANAKEGPARGGSAAAARRTSSNVGGGGGATPSSSQLPEVKRIGGGGAVTAAASTRGTPTTSRPTSAAASSIAAKGTNAGKKKVPSITGLPQPTPMEGGAVGRQQSASLLSVRSSASNTIAGDGPPGGHDDGSEYGRADSPSVAQQRSSRPSTGRRTTRNGSARSVVGVGGNDFTFPAHSVDAGADGNEEESFIIREDDGDDDLVADEACIEGTGSNDGHSGVNVACQWEDDVFKKYPSSSSIRVVVRRDETLQTDASPLTVSTAVGTSRPPSAAAGRASPRGGTAVVHMTSTAVGPSRPQSASGDGRPPSSPRRSFSRSQRRKREGKRKSFSHSQGGVGGGGIVAAGERDEDGILEDSCGEDDDDDYDDGDYPPHAAGADGGGPIHPFTRMSSGGVAAGSHVAGSGHGSGSDLNAVVGLSHLHGGTVKGSIRVANYDRGARADGGGGSSSFAGRPSTLSDADGGHSPSSRPASAAGHGRASPNSMGASGRPQRPQSPLQRLVLTGTSAVLAGGGGGAEAMMMRPIVPTTDIGVQTGEGWAPAKAPPTAAVPAINLTAPAAVVSPQPAAKSSPSPSLTDPFSPASSMQGVLRRLAVLAASEDPITLMHKTSPPPTPARHDMDHPPLAPSHHAGPADRRRAMRDKDVVTRLTSQSSPIQRPQSAPVDHRSPLKDSSSALPLNVSTVNRFYANTDVQRLPVGYTAAAEHSCSTTSFAEGLKGSGLAPRPVTAGTNRNCLYTLATPTVVDVLLDASVASQQPMSHTHSLYAHSSAPIYNGLGNGAANPIEQRREMSRKGRALADALNTSELMAGDGGDEGHQPYADGGGGGSSSRAVSPIRRPHSAASVSIVYEGDTAPVPIPHHLLSNTSGSPSRAGRVGSAPAGRRAVSSASATSLRRQDVRTASTMKGPTALKAGLRSSSSSAVGAGGGVGGADKQPLTDVSAVLGRTNNNKQTEGNAPQDAAVSAITAFPDMPSAKWSSVQASLEAHWSREASLVAPPLRETLRPDLNVLGMDRNDRHRLMNETRSSGQRRPNSALSGSVLSKRR